MEGRSRARASPGRPGCPSRPRRRSPGFWRRTAGYRRSAGPAATWAGWPPPMRWCPTRPCSPPSTWAEPRPGRRSPTSPAASSPRRWSRPPPRAAGTCHARSPACAAPRRNVTTFRSSACGWAWSAYPGCPNGTPAGFAWRRTSPASTRSISPPSWKTPWGWRSTSRTTSISPSKARTGWVRAAVRTTWRSSRLGPASAPGSSWGANWCAALRARPASWASCRSAPMP